MSRYGLIISLPGKDAKSADAKDLAFDSDANVWKIHKQLLVDFTASNQTKTYDHGLSYTPSFLSFERVSGHAYFNWTQTNDFIDSGKLSMLGNSGDVRSVLLLKDFGR